MPDRVLANRPSQIINSLLMASGLPRVGNPNEDEGDRFAKDIGRLASLANALARENWFTIENGEEIDREWPVGLAPLANLRAVFKAAAWECFNNRGKK